MTTYKEQNGRYELTIFVCETGWGWAITDDTDTLDGEGGFKHEGAAIIKGRKALAEIIESEDDTFNGCRVS